MNSWKRNKKYEFKEKKSHIKQNLNYLNNLKQKIPQPNLNIT